MANIKMTPLAPKTRTVVVTAKRVHDLIQMCRKQMGTDGEWGQVARERLQSKVDIVNAEIKADPDHKDEDLIVLEW